MTQVIEENNILSKKEAWELIDEKIRIAEERRENEETTAMEITGKKKSHFWLDLKVSLYLFVCLRGVT